MGKCLLASLGGENSLNGELLVSVSMSMPHTQILLGHT